MTDTKTPSPSDAEIVALLGDPKYSTIGAVREAVARWGQPMAVAGGELVACGNCGGSGRMVRDPDIGTDQECFACEGSGSYSDAAPPPQAVREQTPIRRAALELYTPPFRHEHGYIRDANHQMVADDASSEATELIAARIRGWGRIQYMDKPEMRANALQDEVAEVVAEALNVYWAAHGITKGGQHGPA